MMGERKMVCPKCGSSDINDFVIFFMYKDGTGEDATTLPRFLFEMGADNNFGKIVKVTCHADKKIKGEIFTCGTKVKPTKKI